MPQESNKGESSCGSSSCGSSPVSGGGCPPGIYAPGSPTSYLYRYEAKRAGGVYEQMMRVIRAGNNSNTLSSIRDVQVHKSQSGQNTRVETELQPTGTTADLNINIIMDSDSNLSNALGHPSIEYESLDQTGASDDGPTSTSLGGSGGGGTDGTGADGIGADGTGADGTGADFGGSASSEADQAPVRVPTKPAAHAAGNQSDTGGSPNSSMKTSEDDAQPSSSLASSREGGGTGGGSDDRRGGAASGSTEGSGHRSGSAGGVSGGGGAATTDEQDESDTEPPSSRSPPTPQPLPPQARRAIDSDDLEDDDDDDDDEEGGEGEEGDMDDAQRHFQRYVDGEKVDALRGPGKEDDVKETRKKLPVGHLEKEGVVIGCMSVFSDVHIKEYIVFLSDEMIQAFLVDPGRFRSVASRTKCEIEVTRRILNRRMGRYRWLKYLIVVIRGPSYSAIDQCDKMMTMLFPPFKGRKPYGRPANVSLFLRETTPDNTDLYFNFQRTGPSQRMYGEIPLRAPFRKTKIRPLESTPWKAAQRRQQWGILEPKNGRMETVMSHVYPERGGTYTEPLDHSIKWAEAAEQSVVMSKAKDMARAQMLKARKNDCEPLFANVFGE